MLPSQALWYQAHQGHGNGHLRHSFSSLSSKQSGSPSHCQAPGMQRPLLHMKFPGMLHSLVKLFPGNSWLSATTTKKRNRKLYRVFKKDSRSKMFISGRMNFRQTVLTPVILLYHPTSILHIVLGSTSFLKSWFHLFSIHTPHFTNFFLAVFFLGTYIEPSVYPQVKVTC